MKDHPLAELFPLMPDTEISVLAEDIKKHGQRANITLLDGMILDGRNRWRACRLAKVEPKTRDFPGKDPLEFVLSANLHRRHLSTSQRAMVAANIANLPHGRSEKKKETNSSLTPNVTLSDAAKRLSVSPTAVKEAKTVLADPKQAAAVVNGTKTVHAAAKEIKAAAAAKEIVRDSTGYAIPENVLPLWERRVEVEDIQRSIARARSLLKAATENREEDPLWQGVNVQSIGIAMHNAQRDLDLAVPYAVCPICQGRRPKECSMCKGRGLISKHHFDRCVPAELKEIRSKSCVLK